jgi:hypothetical protein
MIKKEYVSTAPLSIACKLDMIQPANSLAEWSDEAIKSFKSKIKMSTTQNDDIYIYTAKVNSKSVQSLSPQNSIHECNHTSVLIFNKPSLQTDTNNNLCQKSNEYINDALVQEGIFFNTLFALENYFLIYSITDCLNF